MTVFVTRYSVVPLYTTAFDAFPPHSSFHVSLFMPSSPLPATTCVFLNQTLLNTLYICRCMYTLLMHAVRELMQRCVSALTDLPTAERVSDAFDFHEILEAASKLQTLVEGMGSLSFSLYTPLISLQRCLILTTRQALSCSTQPTMVRRCLRVPKQTWCVSVCQPGALLMSFQVKPIRDLKGEVGPGGAKLPPRKSEANFAGYLC